MFKVKLKDMPAKVLKILHIVDNLLIEFLSSKERDFLYLLKY